MVASEGSNSVGVIVVMTTRLTLDDQSGDGGKVCGYSRDIAKGQSSG